MTEITAELLAATPDQHGRFGDYGGRFVPETLISALDELDALYTRLSTDPDFQRELDEDLAHYVGRPSPLYEAQRWSGQLGGARIFLNAGRLCAQTDKRRCLQRVFHASHRPLARHGRSRRWRL